jgi:hypothetical protein
LSLSRFPVRGGSSANNGQAIDETSDTPQRPHAVAVAG